MPKMDGWSVLTALKADPELHEIPVIMLTMVDNKSMGYALGAAEYMTKPINRERLVALLKKYGRAARCARGAGGGGRRRYARRCCSRTLEQDGWKVRRRRTA